MAWTTKDFDETCLGKCLPFPILADHTQTLTRKFDLLDSNQGTAKHAYLILDPKGAIRHKQIGDGKVAFSVEEALTTLSSCKLPVFDQSSFEGMYVYSMKGHRVRSWFLGMILISLYQFVR